MTGNHKSRTLNPSEYARTFWLLSICAKLHICDLLQLCIILHPDQSHCVAQGHVVDCESRCYNIATTENFGGGGGLPACLSGGKAACHGKVEDQPFTKALPGLPE